MKGLENGYVPTKAITNAVGRQLKMTMPWRADDEKLQPLANYYDLEVLVQILQRNDEIPFGLADIIITKLGLEHIWRTRSLQRIYYRANLEGNNGMQRVRVVEPGFHRCERDGCANIFPENPRGRPKRFCSKRCRDTVGLRRRRDARSQTSRRYDTCPAGHDRSPENTYTYVNSKGYPSLRCRVCTREYQRERRAA